MPLLDLPTEILGNMFGRCHEGDLYALRLANSLTCGIATDFLRKEISISYEPDSLQQAALFPKGFRCITKAIKSVKFQTHVRLPLPKSRHWLQYEKHQHGRNFSELERKEEFRESLEHIEQLHAFDCGDTVYESLSALLSACPNVSKLHCAPYRTERVFGQDTLAAQEAKTFRQYLLHRLPRTSRPGEHFRGLMDLLLAAGEAQLSIDTLVVDELSLDTTYWLRERSNTLSIMKDLRKLRLGLYWPKMYANEANSEPDTPNGIIWKREMLLPLIRPAMSLRILILEDARCEESGQAARPDEEELTDEEEHPDEAMHPNIVILSDEVDLSGEEEQVDKPIELEDLLSDLTLPQLGELCLSGLTTSTTYLHDLLLRHKTTLKRLRLADLDCHSMQSWADFFVAIAGQMSALKTLELRGFLRSPSVSHQIEYTFSSSGGAKYGNYFAQRLAKYVIEGIGDIPEAVDVHDYSEYDESEDESEIVNLGDGNSGAEAEGDEVS